MLTLTTTAAAATMLRSPGMAVAARVQPLLLRSTACPYSTAATAATTCSHRLGGLRPKLARAAPPVRAAGTRVPRRHATTTTSAGQQDAAAAAVSASQTALHPDLPPLDWNAFFQLRKTRRRWQLACSMVTCAAGGTLGALFLGSGAADPVVGQIPLDPFVTLGLMTSGFAALGWLVGPSIGSAIFYTMKRKYKMQMTIVSRTLCATCNSMAKG